MEKQVWKSSRNMRRSIIRAIYQVGNLHVIDVKYKKPVLPSLWEHKGFYSMAIIGTTIGLTIYVDFYGKTFFDRRYYKRY